jgi:hypothetical protein
MWITCWHILFTCISHMFICAWITWDLHVDHNSYHGSHRYLPQFKFIWNVSGCDLLPSANKETTRQVCRVNFSRYSVIRIYIVFKNLIVLYTIMIQWWKFPPTFDCFENLTACSPCHPVTKRIHTNLIPFYFRGLYLGFMKLRTSVDAIHITVPRYSPNILPHVKVRDNPHVSR